MEQVIDVLYKISSEMNLLLNGWEKVGENCFWSRGKLFKNEQEAHNFFDPCKLESIDCRFDFVDIEIKQRIYNKLCEYIIEFYRKGNKEDEFLLALGFSINLYYIVGLYSTYGKFDVNRILESVDSEEVREYGELINEFLYTKIVEGMAVQENAFHQGSNSYLDKMVTQYPDFRFGLVYRCIEKGVRFYETEVSDSEVLELLEYKDKLGEDLFWHILGIKDLSIGKYEIVNGKIETSRATIFSDFGIGIPKIKTVDKQEYYEELINNTQKEEGLTNIRKQIESILGIPVIAPINGTQWSYVAKLFHVIEQQKKKVEEQRKKLADRNKKLFELNEQKEKLMNHLAHSWGNECYPEIVKKVADELLRSGQNSLANRLFKAYNSENNLMGQIIFLQSAMEDKPGKLKDIFKDSFYISGNGKAEWKIQTILEEALENLVFSLLNYSGDKKKRNICQKKLCVKHSLKELADDYSKRFEVDKESMSESFIQWFSKNIFPVEIKIDECWNTINFGKTEYGKIVVKNIFTELFTNVLFHGDERCEVILDSTDDKLYLKVRNHIAKKSEGRKKGLESLKEVITKLNYDTSVTEEEGIHYGSKDNMFETVVVFAKDLMFIDEEW